MQIKIKRLNDAFHMEATNEDNVSIHMDSSPDVGGENKGMRPMQLLLSGLGGCSTIDILDILKKQRQKVKDIEVNVSATRYEGEVPSLFKTIHVEYTLYGDLDENKVKRAVDLSLDKYCSVAKILEKTAEITSSFQVKS
ncbi:OsmC family protein [Porifericola rhodea]|uniref:OsmC family protein n=1 Tax=Porifericola rhodea TaxID=930972 RepID=UPI002665C8DF|nr:OsmC family protein [Porifericola rhodea]WKN30445.1 OsmC family protein [Porifericola rhodea]